MALSLKRLITRQAEPDPLAELNAWVVALPMANPPEAQSALITKLAEMNLIALPAQFRMASLDVLFKPMYVVQQACAQMYLGKALPLDAGEQARMQANLEMRRLAAEGYARCVDEAGRDLSLTAAALQRHLATLTALLSDMLQARIQPDALFWKTYNQQLETAEHLNLLTVPVQDPLRYREKFTTTLAAYAEGVLLYTASPHELSQRHVHWVTRWARRWATKLELTRESPRDLSAVPLNIDLNGDTPPLRLPKQGRGMRFLLTSALRKSIRTRITLLQKGKTPNELLLGHDCVQPACGQLLERMYQRWCKGGPFRQRNRQDDNRIARVVIGLNGVRHLLLGEAAPSLKKKQATQDNTIKQLREERERFATFDRVDHVTGPASQLSPPLRATPEASPPPPIESTWRMLSMSSEGFCISRAYKGVGGARVNLGQLIAIELPETSHFRLAALRWVNIDGDALKAGGQLLPGDVQAIHLLDPEKPEARLPAFLLDAPTVTGNPQIVLPMGNFTAGRTLMTREGASRTLTLLEVVARGEDYEVIGYR